MNSDYLLSALATRYQKCERRRKVHGVLALVRLLAPFFSSQGREVPAKYEYEYGVFVGVQLRRSLSILKAGQNCRTQGEVKLFSRASISSFGLWCPSPVAQEIGSGCPTALAWLARDEALHLEQIVVTRTRMSRTRCTLSTYQQRQQ
eukprot:scaffold4163_cov19-Prasinocladus_malaysianus.AAC.1